MKNLSFILVCLLLGACASRSVLPELKDVKVTRDDPPGKWKCREIGKLTGTASSAKGTREEALEDLKKEVANKGGNYVSVKQYSDYGTAVTGIAYECP